MRAAPLAVRHPSLRVSFSLSRRHRTFPPKTCAYCQPLPTGREHNPDERMTPEPLLSGYSSDCVGPLSDGCAACRGLPTGQGLWAEHPSVVRPGLFREDVWQAGARLRQARDARDGHLGGGRSRNGKRPRWRRPCPKRIGGYREFEKRRGYDLRLHRFDIGRQMRVQFAEGRDDALRSVSLGEDLWHILTVDMSLSRLLMLEIYTEFFFILIGAVLLTLVAAAEERESRLDAVWRKTLAQLRRLGSRPTPYTAGRRRPRAPSPRSSCSLCSDGSTGCC